jgi:phosphatidylserine/phosphatidylglycerophosphate/cardiolipin synthase-like enzyme
LTCPFPLLHAVSIIQASLSSILILILLLVSCSILLEHLVSRAFEMVQYYNLSHPNRKRSWYQSRKLLDAWNHGCSCNILLEDRPLSPQEWLKENQCGCRLLFDGFFAIDPARLVTTSQPLAFTLGTGEQILSNIFKSCLETKYELIFATCFWNKRSQSCRDLVALLRLLSEKAIAQSRTIQVRICFSGVSTWSKRMTSRRGKVRKPEKWKHYGLPPAEEIMGLNMVVQYKFMYPCGFMHPKYVIMDRKRAWMPSCDLTSEKWLECCIEMEGEIVSDKMFKFWSSVWGIHRAGTELPPFFYKPDATQLESVPLGLPQLLRKIRGPDSNSNTESSTSSARKIGRMISEVTFPLIEAAETTTVLLPSPHSNTYQERTLPPCPDAWNTFIQHNIRAAKSSIFIVCPTFSGMNLYIALKAAFERGVDIHMILSRKHRELEHMVVMLWTTSYWVGRLRHAWNRAKHRFNKKNREYDSNMRKGKFNSADRRPKLGSLHIGYYTPNHNLDPETQGGVEPTKLHMKMVCFDDEVIVLGSGNMDFTSMHSLQELCVAFYSKEMVASISRTLETFLQGRVSYLCQNSVVHLPEVDRNLISIPAPPGILPPSIVPLQAWGPGGRASIVCGEGFDGIWDADGTVSTRALKDFMAKSRMRLWRLSV